MVNLNGNVQTALPEKKSSKPAWIDEMCAIELEKRVISSGYTKCFRMFCCVWIWLMKFMTNKYTHQKKKWTYALEAISCYVRDIGINTWLLPAACCEKNRRQKILRILILASKSYGHPFRYHRALNQNSCIVFYFFHSQRDNELYRSDWIRSLTK